MQVLFGSLLVSSWPSEAKWALLFPAGEVCRYGEVLRQQELGGIWFGSGPWNPEIKHL